MAEMRPNQLLLGMRGVAVRLEAMDTMTINEY